MSIVVSERRKEAIRLFNGMKSWGNIICGGCLTSYHGNVKDPIPCPECGTIKKSRNEKRTS